MPMLLGTKGNDILQWRASAELAAALKEKLARKWEQSPSGAAESFQEQFIGSLQEELNYEAQLTSELDALNEGIAGAGSPGELLPLKARYQEVVSAHFRRRRSVLALCELCCALHDRLIAKALAFAGERLEQLGQGRAPRYALLVSGDRGRGEQTLQGKNRYFLLHDESASRFLLFLRQVQASLLEVGLPGGDQTLWHGTLKQWRSFVGESFMPAPSAAPETFLAALPPFAAPQKAEPAPVLGSPELESRPAELADLVLVQGEPSLAGEALAAASRALQAGRNTEPFMQLARRVLGLPVALGRFGGWRLERSGEHKGELNLKEYALDPLVMTLRVLALHAGDEARGSVERIRLLQEKGLLDVDLAGRLLQAYQVLMQLRILLEIRDEDGESYCHPEEFSAETEARFRGALEALLNLQKIGYQKLVAQA
jgi:CBS domain-containing protein